MPKPAYSHIKPLVLLFVCLTSIILVGVPVRSHSNDYPTIFVPPDTRSSLDLLPQALPQKSSITSPVSPLSTLSSLEDPEYTIEALAVADFNQDGMSDIAVAGTWDNGTVFLDGTTGQLLYNNSDPRYPVNLLTIGDFNDDGVPDVAAGAEDIYFLDGRTGQTLYTTNMWATAFAVADFTDDGIPDIAAAYFKEVHLVDGSTGEILWTNLDPQESVFALATGDFNQDGIPDVAAGSRDTNIYFIDGLTGMTLYQNSDPTEWVNDLAVADFSQDGVPDVVVGGSDEMIYFLDGSTGITLYNNSDPEFRVYDLVIADFNQDGIPDVAATADTIYVLDGTTGETLWTAKDASIFYGESLVLGDFNTDNVPDIAVEMTKELNFVDGLTGEVLYRTIRLKDYIEVLESGDFNGDGVTDVIAGADALYCVDGTTGKELWTNLPPTWEPIPEEPPPSKPEEHIPVEPLKIPSPKPPKERIDLSTEAHPPILRVNTDPTESITSLAVADFNQDGIDDLVVGSWDDTAYFMDGATGQTMYNNTEPWWMVEVLAVADFNNDGVPDVAAGADDIYFLDGRTGETLRTSVEIGVGQGLEDIAIADFNQDGTPDVVVGGVDQSVYCIDGASGETLFENTDPEAVVASIAVVDLTQDGIPDVVAGSWDKTVYAIDGTSGETLWTNTEPTQFVEALGIEDFNADGIPDVAAAAEGILFLDGTSGETLWHYTDPYTSVNVIEMADFTHDGILDIAAAVGDVYVLDGVSRELLWENKELANVIDNIYDLAIADFNNDGTLDVAAGADGIIYLVDGVTGETFSRNTEPTAHVDYLVEGDFNGDGISDVAAGSEDSNVYLLISDHYAPDLKYCQLPWIPSSKVPLDFQVVYEEPNIDTIWMEYFNEGEIHTIAPSSSTADTVYFSLPEIQQSPLEFWFWANDTWGNIRAQGNETNSYQLDIALEQLWTNTELLFAVKSMAVGDFSGDGIPDVLGVDNTDMEFINGSTGETLYGTEDTIVMAWALATADFNLDGVLDVAAASDYIYFVDGTTGETLVTSTQEMDIVWDLDSADFNLDGVPDVAAGDGDGVNVIDGWSGETIWNNSLGIWVNVLVTTDLTRDGVPEVIVGALDSNVYIFEGKTGTLVFGNTDPIISIQTMTVGDFNGDGNQDVLVGADAIYCINVWEGELLWTNFGPLGAVKEIETADFNNDNIPDIVAGTDSGEVYICDGATGGSIFTIQVAGPIDEGQLVLEDVTKDGVQDVIVATVHPATLYIIDGRTGKIREQIDLEAPPTGPLLVADFNQNGFVDIAIGDSTGQITVIQPLSPMHNLYPSAGPPTMTIDQGERINLLIEMKDAFERGVDNSEVTLLARKAGTEAFTYYKGQNLGNGSYSVPLSTADWRVGEWELYITASDSIYNELEISDYMDKNGYYLPPSKALRIIGKVLPESTMISEVGPFANASQVEEGTNITLQIYLQDAFYHTLSQEEATVLVSFVGPHLQARFEQGRFVAEIPTKELTHGIYQIGITIEGSHLQKAQQVLYVEIIPRFPTMEFAPQFLLIVAVISFLFLLLFMRGIKSIQESIRISPEAAIKTSRRIRQLITILFIITIGGGGLLFFLNPVYSFLVILVAFGEILLLYFLWFFKVIYNRVRNFEEEIFTIRAWWSVIIFSGLVAFPMALSLLVGSQIDWFDYYMKQEITNLVVVTIPSLYWEIGIVSFASGFLLVILTAIWETKKNIEKLQDKKKEVEHEYKDAANKLEPVLYTEIATISSSSFSSLLRSFFIWYLIVIYAFFVTFQLYPYLQLVTSVSVPAGSALAVSLRSQIRSLVRRR